MTLAQPIGPPHRQSCCKGSGEGPAGRMRRDAEEAVWGEVAETERSPSTIEVMSRSTSGHLALLKIE